MSDKRSGHRSKQRIVRQEADADVEIGNYVALDRMLRFAQHEAESQRRQKAAYLIEAAIIALPDQIESHQFSGATKRKAARLPNVDGE